VRHQCPTDGLASTLTVMRRADADPVSLGIPRRAGRRWPVRNAERAFRHMDELSESWLRGVVS